MATLLGSIVDHRLPETDSGKWLMTALGHSRPRQSRRQVGSLPQHPSTGRESRTQANEEWSTSPTEAGNDHCLLWREHHSMGRRGLSISRSELQAAWGRAAGFSLA